jgi:phage-related protein
MAARTAVLAVKIVGDATDATKAFGDVDKAGKGLGDKIDKMMGPATVVFGAIAAGAGVAAAAASDLTEAQNKVNVIFGKSAAEMDAWATSAASSMGLSKRAALEAAGSFGNMFTQIGFTTKSAGDMSSNMIGLAADLASFNNVAGGAEQVTGMMESAFRGEYDSIQALIPTINGAAVQQKALEMTGEKSAAKLTDQAKAAAVYQLIMEDAGAATGDFARSQGSAANAQAKAAAAAENTAAAFGQVLQGAMAAVSTQTATAAAWMSEHTKVVQGAVIAIAGLAAAVYVAKGAMVAWQAATVAFNVVMGIVRAGMLAWTVITNAYAISAMFAAVATNAVLWPVLAVVAAIAALIAVGILVVKNWDTIAGWIGALWNGIKAAAVAVWNAIKATIAAVMGVIKAVITTYLNAVKTVWSTIWSGIRAVVDTYINLIKTAVTTFVNGIQTLVGNVLGFFKALPGDIVAAVGNLGSLLYNKGRELIEGLINGIKSLAGSVGGKILDIVNPFSHSAAVTLMAAPALHGPSPSATATGSAPASVTVQVTEEQVYRAVYRLLMRGDARNGRLVMVG